MKILKNSKFIITSSLAFLGLLLTLLGGVKVAHAGIFCGGTYGSGLQEKTQTHKMGDAILPDVKGNRKYTILDIFPTGAHSYGVPIGTVEGDWFWAQDNNMVEENASSVSINDTQKKRLEQQGKSCFNAQFSFQAFFQNFSKTIAVWFTGLINYSTATFFDQDFICADSNNKNCIPLLEVIGGKNDSDGGIIGVFSRGIFMPLAIVAFLFVAGWLIYNGLIKKQFRSSFGGILWSIFAFFLGILVMTRPMMIARAPHKLNTIISGCLLQAIQGQSCIGGQASTKQLFTNQACLAEASTRSVSEQMQLAISSLSCSVTKGLTLDRWAEQQFGYSFDELYTMGAPNGYSEYSLPQGANRNDFCVSLTINKSPNELKNDSSPTMNSGGHKICNIAAAYMAARTEGQFHTKANMADIIAVAAADGKMWSSFSSQGRDLLGFSALVSTIAAAISFLPIVFYGHAYSLTATILMAFSPIFLLFAIHPGRGKKIFLGWLEAIISAILKFMATGMLILVMILMYSAILGKVSNGFMVLIFTIILAFTFVSYRKELVNLIGVTNMGGAKIANRFAEDFDKRTDKAKHLGTSLVGGAIGGSMAGISQAIQDGTMEDSKLKAAGTIAGGAWKGSGKALGMELGRGRGIVPSMIRQGRQVGQELKADRKEHEKQVRMEAERQLAREDLDKMTGRINSTQNSIQNRADKNHYNAQIEEAYTKSSISGIQEQLQENRANITEAKSANEIKATGEIALKEVAEANLIEKVVVEDGLGVESGLNNYLGKEDALREAQLNKGLSQITDLDEFKQLSIKQQNDVLSSYQANEMLERQRHLEALKGNFEIEKDVLGNTQLVNADLNGNVISKENYNTDFNHRLSQEIEKIKSITPDGPAGGERNLFKQDLSELNRPPVITQDLSNQRQNYQSNNQGKQYPQNSLPELNREVRDLTLPPLNTINSPMVTKEEMKDLLSKETEKVIQNIDKVKGRQKPTFEPEPNNIPKKDLILPDYKETRTLPELPNNEFITREIRKETNIINKSNELDKEMRKQSIMDLPKIDDLDK